MTAEDKSETRQMLLFVAVAYVLLFCTAAFAFHVNGVEVVSFYPIFSGVIAFMTSLGVANYMSTPKDTNAD